MADTPNKAAPDKAAPDKATSPRRRLRRLLLLLALLAALLAAPPLLYWAATWAFLNTPLGPRLLTGSSSRTTLEWRGGHSWIPGQVHVEGFALEGKTPKGSWRLEIDQADLRHRLRPFLERAFVAETVEARGATFRWTSFDEPIELPPRKERSRPGWRLVFPQIEIDGVRRLAFDDNEVDAAARPGSISGAFEVQIRGQAAVPRVELEILDAVVDRENEALARLERLRLAGRLDAFDPRRNRGVEALRFASCELELRTEDWNLSGLSNFFRGLPVRVDGRGELDAHLKIDRGVLTPASRLEVREGRLEIDYLDYRAKGTGGLRLEGDEAAKTSTLTATLDDYSFGRRSEPPHVEGDRLSLIGSGPPLDLADPEPQFSAEIRVPDARVPDFAAFDSVIPPGVPLRLRSGEGRMDLELRLDPKAMSVDGHVEIEGESVETDIRGERITGHLHLEAALERGEIETRRFDLGRVSLDLDRVRSGDFSDWWARLEIKGGEVTLGRPLRLSGETSAVLRDARPLAALLIDQERAVTWLSRLLDEKSVRASADLRFHEDALSLSNVDVAGGSRLRGRGDLLLAGDEITGLLLVEYGRLAAAAELLEGGGRDFKIRGARDWFQSRRDAEAARRTSNPR